MTGSVGVSKSLGAERRTAPTVGNSEEQLWQSIKMSADKVTNMSQKIKDAQDAVDYKDSILALKDGYANIKNDLQTNKDYNGFSPDEYEEKNLELSKALQDKVLSGITNPKIKKLVEQSAVGMGIDSRSIAQSIGHSKFIDRERAKTTKQLNDLTDSFVTDGQIDDLTLMNSVIDGQVAAGIFTEQEGVKFREALSNKAISGHYEKLINLEPLAMYDMLIKKGEEPEDFAGLDEQYKIRLKDKAITDYNKAATEIKTNIIGTWQNMSLDKPTDTWNKFKSMDRSEFNMLNNIEYARLKKYLMPKAGDGVSLNPVNKGRLDRMRDNIVAQAETTGIITGAETFEAFARDTFAGIKNGDAKAQAYIEDALYQLSEASTKYEVAKTINEAPLTDGKTHIDSIVDSVKTAGVTTGPGAKLYQTALATARTAYDKKIDLVKTDSKALFDKVNPTIKKPTASATPKELGEYNTKVDDWYNKQGVPVQLRRMFTNDEADLIVKNFEESDPLDVLVKIDTVEARYQGNAPRVFRELGSRGLPTEVSIITALSPVKRKTVGIDIVNAFKMDEVDFAKAQGVEAADKRMTTNEYINSNENIKNFEKSVYSSGTTAGNMKRIGDIKTAVRRLSYFYMSKGVGDKEAVKKASNAIFENMYKYVEYNNSTIRMSTDLSEGVVEEGLEYFMDNLTADDLSDVYKNPDWRGINRKVNERNMMNNLKNNFTFVNVGGLSNVVELQTPDGLPILGKNGKPIRANLSKLKLKVESKDSNLD